jgi:hypothetical protein
MSVDEIFDFIEKPEKKGNKKKTKKKKKEGELETEADTNPGSVNRDEGGGKDKAETTVQDI